MRRIILISIMTIALIGSSFAQGIYFRVGSGYGFPAATSQIGENYLHSSVYDGNIFTDDYSTEVVTASYGAGVNFNIAFGYKFNENFIFDFNVIYLAGRKFETSNIQKYEDLGYTTLDKLTVSSKSSGVYFNPTLIFSAGFGKYAPYGRFGVIVASPKVVEDETFYSNSDGEITTELRWEYSGGAALGYQAAIGMNWEISDRLDIFTEVNFVSMTYYPNEGNMTKHIEDGVDNLDQWVVSFRKKVFEKSYDPTIAYDPDKPQVLPREATPFSYISTQVGIRFSILKIDKTSSGY